MLIPSSGKQVAMFFVDIFRSRELLIELVRRDLTSKYRETLIGFFWNVINPLATLGVYTFVFSVIYKGGRGVPGNFAVFLYCGLVPWLAFAEALNRCSTIIVSHTGLVKNAVIPLEILPCYIVVSSVFGELIGVGILLTATLATAKTLSLFVVYVPLLIVLQAFFALGLGMLCASLTVFFRDIGQLVPIVLRFGIFLTPIVYPETALPDKLQFLLWINPMALLVNMFRDSILNGKAPELSKLAIFSAWAIIMFFIGLIFFKKTKWDFADVI